MSEKKKKKGLSVNGHSIFLSCEEANHTCDKTQYKEASLWEKIKLNIHLMYCGACRKYTKNNTKLTKILKDQNVSYMNEKEVSNLEKQFQEELKSFSDNNK